MSVKPNWRMERFELPLTVKEVRERQERVHDLLREALGLMSEIGRGTVFKQVEVHDELLGASVVTVDAKGGIIKTRDATPEERTLPLPGTR